MSASKSNTDIRKGVHRGLAWVGLASSLVGVFDLLAYVLLVAFWIPKEDFGTALLAFSVFPVLDLATDLGLAAAAIQRDDHSPSRISTVFWLNVAMSILLFAFLALGLGPFLAWLQKAPILAGMFTFYGAKLIWQNVYFLPLALMKRELRFKELSVIRMIANVAEFAGKVGSAAAGFGIWCFVIGPICRVLVTGIGVQICHPWKPSFIFKFSEGWDWAKFGLKTSAHKILFRLYNIIDYQIVGLYFGKAEAGVYGIAFMIVLEPALVISEVTINVAFPTFAKLKNQRDRLYEQLVSFCKMNLIIMLAFLGLAFVAAEEILAIFSIAKDNDYSAGAPVIRILCGVALLRALSFVIPPFLDGVGRPTLTLIYTAVASVVLSACFLGFAHVLGDRLGIVSVALAWLVGYPVAFFVLVTMAFAILEMPAYKFYQRLSGIMASGLVASVLAGGAKWATLELPTVLRFIITATVMMGSFGILLARFQGISVRTVARSLKSD